MPSTAPSRRAFHMGSPPGRDPTDSSATRPSSSPEIAALRAALESGLDVPAPIPSDIARSVVNPADGGLVATTARSRSEEHTSELQSLMRISYAVFCLKKK